jgi:hypothetical protein
MKFEILLLASLAFVASQDCGGPICDGGCCPEANFVCCGDKPYCADTLVECPDAKPEHVKKLQVDLTKFDKVFKVKADCSDQQTVCDAGCCPYQDYYCCPDQINCATTAGDCP